ncbi:MAG: hypothetical protein GTN78_18485, partial [Gemmatimonadales bacterium]|nr:hypothetical protein [Gemmatimonadales bacterium]
MPREKLKEFGIRPFLHGFWGVEWTAHGLTVTIMRELADGAHEPVAVLLDATGKLARPLPGFLVGSDGTVYS